MGSSEGKMIFWRRMGPKLKRLESEDRLKDLKEKLEKKTAETTQKQKKNQTLKERLKTKTKTLAKAREKKWLTGKKFLRGEQMQLWLNLVRA